MKALFLKIIFSFFSIGIFLFIAVGYELTDEATFKGYDPETGNYSEARYTKSDKLIWSITGKKGKYGGWDGVCLEENRDYIQKVTYADGVRHGKVQSKSKKDGSIKYYCYNMNKIVPCDGNIQSNMGDTRRVISAFEVLENRYPWFLFENLSNEPSNKDTLKLFMTAIEKKLNTYTLNNNNFDTYFEEVVGSIDSFSGYSNWYQLSGRFASGENEARNFEFRRAVIERYTTTKRPIVDIIQNRYPYFRNEVENGFNISATEFDEFCNEFDGKMDLKINIPVSDPFYIDSLDNWMGQIFSEYFDDDHNLTFTKLKFLFSQSNKSDNRYDVSPQSLVSEYLQKNRTDTVPVYEAILTLLFTKVLEVDAIKLSIREACLTNQNVPLPPEIVTNILGQNTEGIRVRGLITFDGNDAITKSGIVWDTVYHPEITPNNMINAGNEHDFNIFIGGLMPGKKYFVRSYAINSTGLVYGNTLEFIAGEVSSNKDIKYDDVSWRVYPNPTDDQINITFKDALPEVEVSIYSLNGYQIFNRSYKNMSEIAINVCDWPSGTYTIECNKGAKIKQTKRVIIQR